MAGIQIILLLKLGKKAVVDILFFPIAILISVEILNFNIVILFILLELRSQLLELLGKCTHNILLDLFITFAFGVRVGQSFQV